MISVAQGSGQGLLQLGATEVTALLPSAWGWWRQFAARYVTGLCAAPEAGVMTVPLPALAILQTLVLDAPPMLGADYLTPLALAQL